MNLTKSEEAKIRRLARAERCPVKVVLGYVYPRAVGERGSSEFKGGGACKYPGSAMRAGYKVKYIRSTYRVEVGLLWLKRQAIEKRLRSLDRRCDLGQVALWCKANGELEIAAIIDKEIMAQFCDAIGQPEIAEELRKKVPS